MFAILVTGRLVQTDFQQVSENQWVFNVDHADDVRHIVVFMTGAVAFPPGTAASVYLSWPSPNGPSWSLLGFISNEKPSAIFKIANLKRNDEGVNSHPFGVHGDQNVMQVGISVESTLSLSQLTTAAGSQASEAPQFEDFCRKMLENFYNYASSFMASCGQITSSQASSESYIPVSTLHSWYNTFIRRFNSNPDFWK